MTFILKNGFSSSSINSRVLFIKTCTPVNILVPSAILGLTPCQEDVIYRLVLCIGPETDYVEVTRVELVLYDLALQVSIL
jgi:hypothetical protein